MTDPQPEPPFDPDAASRVQAYLDARAHYGRNPEVPIAVIGHGSPSHGASLKEAHLREVLRQLAYTQGENRLLAEKCAAWRGQYEGARADLEAVRGWTRSNLDIADRAANATWKAVLDDLTRVLDHLDTIPAQEGPATGE